MESGSTQALRGRNHRVMAINLPDTSGDGPEARSFPVALRAYAEVLAMVAASTLIGRLMAPAWGTGPVDLLYLPPVLAAASLHGLRPALTGAAASTLAYNFFFTAPLHSFRIDRPSDLVTVIILFAVAVVTSQLAARMRSQARIAAANAARNATIAGLARQLLSCSDPAAIGTVACREIASLFECNAVLIGRAAQDLSVLASEPPGAPLTPSDIAAAGFALELGEPAGRGARRADPAEWLFYPVKSESEVLAVMGLARDDGRQAVPDERSPLLTNLLDQVALALQRSALEAEVRGLDQVRERDRLRGALLSSVGHDLRTPLTAIVAAVGELRAGPEDDEALLATVETETDKLGRYIANLLDMARLEAGTITLRQEPTDLVDAVSAALGDLRQSLSGHSVRVDLPDDLPLVRADPQLLHHVLINLLDNAARYSDVATRIALVGRREGEGVSLSVIDEGPGLPSEDIFARFQRVEGSDRKGGAGLGLAIVKGFADAMGIGISAADREDGGGAAFTLRFPVALALTAANEADAEQTA